jgi:SCY1-like protein 1
MLLFIFPCRHAILLAYFIKVLEIISPMMYISEQYLGTTSETTTTTPSGGKDVIAKEIGPTVAILFGVNDRGVRGSLLQKVTFLCKHLDDHALNVSVFEPMCSGFSDSSPALRELTLKATLTLVPKLTPPNLEKLSRYLVRLQGDAEPAIRTNTVIFFSHLAPYMTEMSRQKLLLPAFCRSMQDPFTPCRLAALQSTLKARQWFDAAGIASKVLPAVTPCLIDASPDVRKEAFAAVDELLFVLRQESERLLHLPVATGDGVANGSSALGTAATRSTIIASAPASAGSAPISTNNPAAAPASGGSGGGYFSSWLTSSTKSSASAAIQQQSPTPSQQQQQQRTMAAPSYAGGAPPLPMAHLTLGNSNHNNTAAATADDSWNDDDNGADEDAGWGDDDLDISDGAGRQHQQQQHQTAAAAAAVPATRQFAKSNMDDEDDFFASAALDAKPARPVVMMNTAAAAKNRATTMGGGGGKLAVPGMKKTTTTTAASKPAVKKLSAAEDLSDNWDDF